MSNDFRSTWRRFAAVCAGALVLAWPSPARAEDENHNQAEMKAGARQLLIDEDFDILERIADKLATAKSRFPDGQWKLAKFYDGLEEPPNPNYDKEWQDWMARMDRWSAKEPGSMAAAIAHAGSLVNYAWKARGGGWGDSVTTKGWKLMGERLKQARKILEDAAANLFPNKKRPPEWYGVMFNVALGQQWPKADAQQLFEQATAEEPQYTRFYSSYAYYLLPRWYGSEGEWQQVAAQWFKGPKGPTLYARTVWNNYTWDLGDNLFTSGGIDWNKMKAGFEEIEKDFPGSNWNLNAFCRFACLAGDKETAARLFERIGSNLEPGIWQAQEFNRRKAWATGT